MAAMAVMERAVIITKFISPIILVVFILYLFLLRKTIPKSAVQAAKNCLAGHNQV